MGKSLIRPLTKTLLGSLITSSIKPIQRYVTTLNPAGGMYYDTKQPTNLQGDFEFEVTFFRGSQETQGQFVYCEQNSATLGYGLNLYITGGFPDGAGSAGIFGTSKGTTGVGGLSEFKLYTLVFVMKGTTLTIYLDGTLKATYTDVSLGASTDIVSIGKQATSTGYGLTGGVFNLKIWKDGDRNTGQLVRDYHFDDNDGVLVNYAIPLGVELVVNGNFSSDTAWTKVGGASIGGGVAVVNGVDQTALIYQDVLTLDSTYLVEFEVTDNDDNIQNRVIDNSGAELFRIRGVGSFKFAFTHKLANGNFLFRASGGSYTVSNISIKQADGYGQSVNVTAADRELYGYYTNPNRWIGTVSGKVIEVAQ